MFKFYSWNQFNSYTRAKDTNTYKFVPNNLGKHTWRMTAGGHTAANVLNAFNNKSMCIVFVVPTTIINITARKRIF